MGKELLADLKLAIFKFWATAHTADSNQIKESQFEALPPGNTSPGTGISQPSWHWPGRQGTKVTAFVKVSSYHQVFS